MTVAACTGDPDSEQTGVAAPAPSAAASPSPSPSASSSDAVLHGASGRTYRIRIAADHPEISMTGGPGETLREHIAIPGRYVAPQVVPDGPLEGLSPDS